MIRSAPIPPRMRTLEKDARGYPIPFIVVRDKTGGAQFPVNDFARFRECIGKRLCAICGKRISRGFWFVGGSRCFLHPRGAFIDPPLHLDCAEYALSVCPFLAAPSYARRIDDPGQPKRFGLGVTPQYRMQAISPSEFYLIADGWDYVEFWRGGEPCAPPDSPYPEDTNDR
jgi:hypothetical protein